MSSNEKKLEEKRDCVKFGDSFGQGLGSSTQVLILQSIFLSRVDYLQGVERFSSYSGYGKTFEFTGDFKDESQVSNQFSISLNNTSTFLNPSVVLSTTGYFFYVTPNLHYLNLQRELTELIFLIKTKSLLFRHFFFSAMKTAIFSQCQQPLTQRSSRMRQGKPSTRNQLLCENLTRLWSDSTTRRLGHKSYNASLVCNS